MGEDFLELAAMPAGGESLQAGRLRLTAPDGPS